MKTTKVAATLLLPILALSAIRAGAHHNMSAIFDFNDRVTVTGTFTSYDWRNPHIELIVEAAGVTWKVEGPAPGFFRTREVTKTEFEKAIGQTVTVEMSRARDGSRSGLLREITMPGGQRVSACPQNC